MGVAGFFFYLFSAVAVGAAFMVITARNPVHSVLFLILTFISAAGLFILLGAEFLAMILVVVYVGAVAVLFLFVVMMLDIDLARMREGFLQSLPFGALLGVIVLAQLVAVAAAWIISPEIAANPNVPIPPVSEVSNTEALGHLIYTKYVYFFQAAGMILLVAMIGAIVLTLRHKEHIKRQDIGQQVARTPETAVEVVEVEAGQGLKS